MQNSNTTFTFVTCRLPVEDSCGYLFMMLSPKTKNIFSFKMLKNIKASLGTEPMNLELWKGSICNRGLGIILG